MSMPERTPRTNNIGGDEPPKRSNNVMMVIIAAVIIALLASFVGFNMLLALKLIQKVNYDKVIKAIVADIGALKSSIDSKADSASIGNKADVSSIDNINKQITQLQNTINSMQQSIASISDKRYVDENYVNNQISNNIGNMRDTLNSLQTTLNKIGDGSVSLASLQSTLTTLNTQLTAAEAKITAIQAQLTSGSGGGGSGGSGALPFTYITLVTNEGDATSGTDNTTTLSVKLTLENKTDKPLEDIGIVIPVEIDAVQDMTSFSMAVSGWTIQKYGIKYLLLKGHGMKLNANEKKRIYFDITLNFPVAIPTSYWSGSVVTDDIDILSWDYK